MKKAYDNKEAVVKVKARLKDFDGDLTKWKDSFYELWREQLTWDFAYRIDLMEYRETGVRVEMLVRPAYKDSLIEAMKELGYREIDVQDEDVGLINAYERDGLDDVADVFVEW